MNRFLCSFFAAAGLLTFFSVPGRAAEPAAAELLKVSAPAAPPTAASELPAGAPRGDLLTFNPAYMDEFRNFGEPLRLLYQQLSNLSMNTSISARRAGSRPTS